MSDLFWLTKSQRNTIKPYFPPSRDVARVDDLRVISGIIHVLRRGLQWRNARGPHKTLYNRFIRWSRMGVFNRIFAGLAAKGGKPNGFMIDAIHLKAHRTACSLLKKGMFPAVSAGSRIGVRGQATGGLNSKLHAVCNQDGNPLILLLSEGQMSDYKGARRIATRYDRCAHAFFSAICIAAIVTFSISIYES